MASDAATITRYAEVRDDRHPVALIATILVHALLLVLLLTLAPPLSPVEQSDRTLTAFDAVPPLPRADPPTPPPPARMPDEGGKTARDAAPQPTREANAPPIRPTTVVMADAPPAPLTPSLQPADGQGTAVGTAGDGGIGSGVGNGNGDGSNAVRYRAAEWIHYPTLAEINPFWPASAKQRRVAGKAILACELKRPGRPDRCWTIGEEPAGEGFGAAAVRMSRVFRIRPVMRNDDTFDMPVIIPVIFEVPPATPAKR